MLRFSFVQVQNYTHSAGLHLAKLQTGSSYKFKVFDDAGKTFLDDDHLFETDSLAEVVAFIRGYRKAVAKAIRIAKQESVNQVVTKPSLNRKRQIAAKAA